MRAQNHNLSWPAAVLLLLPVLVAIASPALADNRNAATWYNRALGELDRLSDEQWQMLKDYAADPSGPPTPELRMIAARGGVIINLLRDASTRQYSDYGFDFDVGFELQIPHVQPLLWKLTPLVQVDTLIRLQDGDSGGAADRLATLYRMSEHLGDDHIPISSIVGDAVFKRAQNTLQTALDRGALNAADANALVHALSGFDSRDPFNMVEALAMEKWVSVDWIGEQFSGEEGGEEFAQYMLSIMGEGAQLPEAMLHMDREMFDAELVQMDSFMDEVIGAFAMEDTEAGRARLKQLEAEAAGGEHGMMVAVFSWEYARVFELMVAAREAIAAQLAMLEQLASGQLKPIEAANAALWYLRGIAALEKPEEPALKAIRDFDLEAGGKVPEDLAASLTEMQPIIDTFREGSLIKRCDFSVVRDPKRPELVPVYAPGLHDALRLLLIDTAHRLACGQTEAAVDRLNICHRMIGHLSGDDPIIVSLIAHRAFVRTLAILGGTRSQNALTDEHRRALETAMLRIPRKDPFGYVISVVAAREHLPGRLGEVFPALSGDDEAPLREQIARWSGDRLLYVLAMLDAMARAGREKVPDQSGDDDPLRRLADIITPAELAKIGDQIPMIAPALAQGDHAILNEVQFPPLGRVVENMRRARADLRRGADLLRSVNEGGVSE
ncbi:MAG: hypothetical protein JSV91_15745 [Phycisphaerales bacterium]|nr:MAG: hypothetical protein JSV91_15745 [Phycisphaerales bacterium]